MSQIVTPPDVVKEDIVYLIVNAEPWDLEMVVQWLKVNNKEYTIHLYHDGMSEPDWLNRVGSESELVLVQRSKDTAPETMDALLDHVNKIKWFGEEQEYPSAVEYLVKNG